jgi:hypothetical protein
VISLPSGTYPGVQTVTITDATAGAMIYYTTNGSTPTASSAVYSGAIAVNGTETLNAIAVAPGYSNSAVASAAYTITGASQAATSPAFSVPGGTYHSAQTVTISDPDRSATIYYTLNGSMPTIESAVYTRPILIANSATLQAIALAAGSAASTVTSATYDLVVSTPVFSPPSGTYPGPLIVTVTDATPGANIFYTPNGNVPPGYATYTGPITLAGSGKIYSLGQLNGYATSSTVEAIYTIEPVAATPIFSVLSGTCKSALTVAMSDATAGAEVFYTLDGMTPTTASNRYATPVTMHTGQTLKAAAAAPEYSLSSIAMADCTTRALPYP